MTKARKTDLPATLLQLKITLRDIRPPIWRRVVVADDLSFEQLHWVIQMAMGWDDQHMHEFDVGGERIGGAEADPFGFGNDAPIRSERTTRLRDILGARRKFRYCYDFGDDWRHEIVVEKRLPAAPGEELAPRLIDGKRACPPEDCGGPWGYADLLDVLADPQHPHYKEMLEWAGELDPEYFDVDAAAKLFASTFHARKAP